MKTIYTESGYINNGLKTITEQAVHESDESFNCPCHNEPCLWTSYNPELAPGKKDHYTCSVTKRPVVDKFSQQYLAEFKQAQQDMPNVEKYFGDKDED